VYVLIAEGLADFADNPMYGPDPGVWIKYGARLNADLLQNNTVWQWISPIVLNCLLWRLLLPKKPAHRRFLGVGVLAAGLIQLGFNLVYHGVRVMRSPSSPRSLLSPRVLYSPAYAFHPSLRPHLPEPLLPPR